MRIAKSEEISHTTCRAARSSTNRCPGRGHDPSKFTAPRCRAGICLGQVAPLRAHRARSSLRYCPRVNLNQCVRCGSPRDVSRAVGMTLPGLWMAHCVRDHGSVDDGGSLIIQLGRPACQLDLSKRGVAPTDVHFPGIFSGTVVEPGSSQLGPSTSTQ
jgi:hypothetical protein